MSKPNIDLSSPLVKETINIYNEAALSALSVPQTVEQAIIPIYFSENINIKPVQIGTGVLVNIKDEYFIFSASHVFDDMGNYQLLIGDGQGNELIFLEGERFSSGKGKSGRHVDDPIDASVFHIQSDLPKELKDIAITIEQLDGLTNSEDNKSMYIMAGFRVKKSKTIQNVIKSSREGWVSCEITNDQYCSRNIESDYNIVLRYDDQILVDGKWQTSPTPRGFSGGGIIRIDGLSLFDRCTYNSKNKQLLSGIIIEQRRGKHGQDGVLIGTRVKVFLLLIKYFLPNLLDDHF